MKQAEIPDENSAPNHKISIAVFSGAAFLVYCFSNPKPQHYYDYTFRVAENILRGGIGFAEKPPSWLNEFVPFAGNWYSVFPLGSVLTMIPFALFKTLGIIKEMPGALIAALSASAISVFLYLIASRYKHERSKRILLTASVLFGTWMWTNLTFAGAWQLALGFAMIGELGAIYFTVYNRKPFLAGAFFALAFGNRTENLLTAPIFMFLLARPAALQNYALESEETENLIEKKKKIKSRHKKQKTENQNEKSGLRKLKTELTLLFIDIRNNPRYFARLLAAFCVVPFVLGAATLIYNYVRFRSFTDFGYARIPGVLEEPWYRHGIFSVHYIRGQAYEMLFRLWESKADFPFYVPNGFSSSILLTSPFLFFALRRGALDKTLKYAAWAAIFILTFLLWIHGNSGGWQFGYRYAMILLPWIFLILLENSPRKITVSEQCLYGFSIVANAYAAYLFHWTEYVKP